MSSDPLGLAAGINTYGYVSGNSLGNSDRLGLLAQLILVKDSFYNYDHIAIRINQIIYSIGPTGYPLGGLYSKADIGIQNIKDFNNYYSDLSFKVLTLNLSTEEEKDLVVYFLKLNTNQEFNYSILGNQCATVANNALNSISIANKDFNNSSFKRPIHLYESLLKNNKVLKNETYTPKNFN